MSEGELVDAFRHVSDAFEQTSETIGVRANNAINDMNLNRSTSAEPLYQRAGGRERNYRLTPLGIGVPTTTSVSAVFYAASFLL